MTDRELKATWTTGQNYLRWGRGCLRVLRPVTLDSDTAAWFDETRSANVAVDMFPLGHQMQMRKDYQAGLDRDRRVMAGISLHYLNGPIETIIRDGREAKRMQQRDVRTTCPEALEQVSQDGLISLGVYRLMQQARLVGATVKDLRVLYEGALKRKDAPATVDLELVEHLVDAGLTVQTQDERPAARDLRDLISAVQYLRLAHDFPDFEAVGQAAAVLRARASALNVQPVNPDQQPAVWKVFQGKQAAIEAAGAASDEESLEDLRASMAGPVEAPTL